MSRQESAVTVREAEPSDLEALAACHTACWHEAYAGLVPQPYLDDPAVIHRRVTRWRQRLAHGRAVYVATDGGEVIGLAGAGPSPGAPPPAELELMSLYVRASHQGTGVAERLLDRVLGNGAASLWVFESNARANAFYRRHGFRPDGIRVIDTDTGVPEIRLVRPEPG